MIGRSFPEYVFIRLSILGLRLITPLSIVYLCFSWHHGHFLFSPWLALYAAAEASFFLLVFVPRTRFLQKAATHPPLPSREEREVLFAKCFDTVMDSSLATGWFFFVPPELIRRENITEWLLWALFGTLQAGLEEEWTEELESYVHNIERLLGCKVEEGGDQGVGCMKVSLDPVHTIHRPLLWYTIVACIDTLASIQLYCSGFRHHTSGGWTDCFPPRIVSAISKESSHPDLIYWLRPHRSTTKDPILFLHGIGIGLWSYVPFFQDLIAADPDVGIIAIEVLAISMRISQPPLSRPAMLTALTALLTTHSITNVIVAAHSYGTVVAAHILRDPVLSARVSAWLLVDPIPFLLHQPTVAYNFVYRPPRHANEWQLWYFASRDADIARTLARHFFWAENILWKDDLEGKRVAVILSGKDQIVGAPKVREYLTGEEGKEPRFRWEKDGLQVLYYPELDHAQVFDTKQRRRPLVDILHDFAQRPISS